MGRVILPARLLQMLGKNKKRPKRSKGVIEWLREQREKEYRESAVGRRRGAKADKEELVREEGLKQESLVSNNEFQDILKKESREYEKLRKKLAGTEEVI